MLTTAGMTLSTRSASETWPASTGEFACAGTKAAPSGSRAVLQTNARSGRAEEETV